MNLENGADRPVDASLVPDQLKSFILLASRFGYQRQSYQDLFATRMSEERNEESKRIVAVAADFREQVAEWNRAFTGSSPDQIAGLADDADHPYWVFSDALNVIDLLDVGQRLTPEAESRASLEALRIRYGDIAANAEELFRIKDFHAYVELIEPYESILSRAQLAKLNIARKRLA